MAKTNAQRQAAYRVRQLEAVDGAGERLNTIIDVHAKSALERLAKCYGVTQREVLERLITGFEGVTVKRLGDLPNGQTDYYEGKGKQLIENITVDEAMGMAWWNSMSEQARSEWATKAGTGIAADAWEMFKAESQAGGGRPPIPSYQNTSTEIYPVPSFVTKGEP